MVIGVPSRNGRVPSALPPILKNYTKSAIRTQPHDLIAWSYAYFHALREGDSPPVKEQIEFPLPNTESGVSPGLMRVLNKKFGSMETISKTQFEDLCKALGVKEWAVEGAWNAVGKEDEGNWKQLLVTLISQEAKTPQQKLSLIMETVTEDVMSKSNPVDVVLNYFDKIHSDDDPEEAKLHAETKEYLSDVASFQDGNLYPSDLSRPSCPLSQLGG